MAPEMVESKKAESDDDDKTRETVVVKPKA